MQIKFLTPLVLVACVLGDAIGEADASKVMGGATVFHGTGTTNQPIRRAYNASAILQNFISTANSFTYVAEHEPLMM